ncbi:hypothetical protein LPJ61_000037 [Coemansia biformis]|uniref:Major facilitator superfamily (MFS) profile domain-containing protein n=1 Tax=Coemansia biformis TaxID=1286918 RepID=A0A9W7YCC6_9FUNG|nr:hypothetical protein LPJ61_000037 [Coemansia biformis]
MSISGREVQDKDGPLLGTEADEDGCTQVEAGQEFPPYTRYLVVAGSFVIQGLACGVVHAWGVQLEYLASHEYAGDDAKIRTLSYVGALMFFGIYFWGMPAGWIAEVWSYPKLCLIGTVIMALGQLLASFCKEPWQLCLAEGVVFGIGIGLVYGPASTAPARWFTKHRGLATGIAVAGVGVGGLAIAPLTEFLMHKTSVAWSQRITAIYILVLGAISSMAVRVPAQDRSRSFRSFDWRSFGSARFAIHTVMVFFVTAAYIVPYMFLPKFWVQHGISPSDASVLIALANVASSVGRVAVGFAADYIGALNSLMIVLVAAAAACLAVWPFATSFGSGLAMGLFYGFSSGGYWTLLPLAAASLFGIDRLASNAGTFYSVSAVGAWLGTPVADAILSGPGGGIDYLGMSLYTGALWAAALAAAVANRWLVSPKVLAKA